MDYATGQLGYNITAISHKIWKPVKIIVILRSSELEATPWTLAAPRTKSFSRKKIMRDTVYFTLPK